MPAKWAIKRAMSDAVADPLLLGQRVVAILETGQRDATYKLATLMALIDHCIENLPQKPEDVLRVPLSEFAYRVLALYWPQIRAFEGHELRQRRTGTRAQRQPATRSSKRAAKRSLSTPTATEALWSRPVSS